jgi:hypothetical protein
MKKLYFSDNQIKDIALYATGVTSDRWPTSPADLLDLANRLRGLAAAAPMYGPVRVIGSDGSESRFTGPQHLLEKAAGVAEKAAQERLTSCMSLFRDVVDCSPQPEYEVKVNVLLEERD